MFHAKLCERIGFVILIKQIFLQKEFSVDTYAGLIDAFDDVRLFGQKPIVTLDWVGMEMRKNSEFFMSHWEYYYCPKITVSFEFLIVQSLFYSRYKIVIKKINEKNHNGVMEEFLKVSPYIPGINEPSDDIKTFAESDVIKNIAYILPSGIFNP